MSTAQRETPFRLGLIVNPIAGMGGAVGLRGTDGEAGPEAVRRGARPVAAGRAARALTRLSAERLVVLTASGDMGEAAARGAGLEPVVVHEPRTSDAADTIRAATQMRHADLILFAGGDGTARDVLAAVGRDVPILGIPTGVKMHSAAFATTPENAGLLASAMAAGGARVEDREIVDLDETLLRLGIVATSLFGIARVPRERRMLQQAKRGGGAPDAGLAAACDDVADTLEPGVTYVLGPGTTTLRVLARLGLTGTLLGVDLVRDGALIGRDLSEAEILRLIDGRPARIIVGVTGGQGCLFGRGNQQISAAVIRGVGLDRITILASADKVASLESGAMFVDTGDVDLDARLGGFHRVRTAPGRFMLCRVVA